MEFDGERGRDAERKQKARAAARDLKLPPVADPERRAKCRGDVFLFLETYFADTFDGPWTPTRQTMVETIFAALQQGTAKALAAPRGEGKTTITECVICYCICYGTIEFAVICAATGEFAKDRLEGIKHRFERSELLLEDFPEICVPVRDAATAPQRCGSQTVNGELTHMQWSGDTVIFPDVAGSPSSGIVVVAKGITGALRGLNINDRRPDLVIIDDPDDEESAESVTKTSRRVRKINQSLRGLAKSGQSLARVMLCTIINRSCVAAQYTDRTLYPSWNGQRFKTIDRMPNREDMWEEYIKLRKEDQQKGDVFARRAHQFYLDNREEMDAGAVVSNPESFDGRELEDGTLCEASTLQRCFNQIAETGWDAFATEFQNEPPAEGGIDESGITEAIVCGSDEEYIGRVSGLDRLVAPVEATKATAFIDVHKRHLDWTVVAWSDGGRVSVVDYGVTSTHGPDVVGEEEAILSALRELRDMFQTEPVVTVDGENVPLAVCLVDCGYQPDAVYRFCRESGPLYHPAMGDPRFKRPRKPTAEQRPGGDWWYWSQVKSATVGRIWVVNHFPDRWKHTLHEMFLTVPIGDDRSQPEGTITLWGLESRDHQEYATQICAEVLVTEHKEGQRGEKTYWYKRRKDNHWLDATCGCLVGAAIGDAGHGPQPAAIPGPDQGGGQFIRRPSQRERSGGFIRKRNR